MRRNQQQNWRFWRWSFETSTIDVRNPKIQSFEGQDLKAEDHGFPIKKNHHLTVWSKGYLTIFISKNQKLHKKQPNLRHFAKKLRTLLCCQEQTKPVLPLPVLGRHRHLTRVRRRSGVGLQVGTGASEVQLKNVHVFSWCVWCIETLIWDGQTWPKKIPELIKPTDSKRTFRVWPICVERRNQPTAEHDTWYESSYETVQSILSSSSKKKSSILLFGQTGHENETKKRSLWSPENSPSRKKSIRWGDSGRPWSSSYCWWRCCNSTPRNLSERHPFGWDPKNPNPQFGTRKKKLSKQKEATYPERKNLWIQHVQKLREETNSAWPSDRMRKLEAAAPHHFWAFLRAAWGMAGSEISLKFPRGLGNTL